MPGEFYQTLKEDRIPITEAVSKNRNGRKTPKLFPRGQHYPDPKTKQRPQQKGELQTNIPDEYGRQNPQQDPSQ